MSSYIENPINQTDWNPEMGDFFSQRVYEEDKIYEKKQFMKKVFISGLISIHMFLFAMILIYFA